MELEGLIRNVLQESLRQINAASPAGLYDPVMQKKYLIVVTGGEMTLSQAVDFTRTCIKEKIPVSLVLSQSAVAILSKSDWCARTGVGQVITEQSNNSIMDLLKEHQELVVPILTVNSAAKIAAGITDTLATGLIFHGLLMGKPVLAARESCDPDYLNYFVQEGNPGAAALRSKMKENQQDLAAMGVKFCLAGELMDKAMLARENISSSKGAAASRQPTADKKVITVGDLQAVEPGTTVAIGINTIITPSARDLAAERKIVFCRQS